MKRILFLVLVIGSLASCLKKKELPDEPQISLSAFDITSSGATLKLHFTDGNGNFGLDDADTTGIFADCIRAFNLYAEYYELQDGEWEHIIIDPCDEPDTLEQDLPFYNRVPWVKPTGQDQTQDGEIRVDMDNWFLPGPYDTIRFEIHIVDREMNESNTIIAGPFVKSH